MSFSIVSPVRIKSFQKVAFLISSLLFYHQFSFSQRAVITKVKEEGYSVTIKFITIKDELDHSGLTMKVTPTSPEELNSLFKRKTDLNGRFHYSSYDKSRNDFFVAKKSRKKKKDEEKPEVLILLDGLEYLLYEGKINETEYDALVEQAENQYLPDSQKILIRKATSYSNPYITNNNQSLGVYKMELHNSTSEYKTIENKFIINNGTDQFSPMSEEDISTHLQRNMSHNPQKSETLERYNLSKTTTIPPKSSVIKYFAAIPVDPQSQDLSISHPDIEGKFEWRILPEQKIINAEYSFYEFELAPTYNSSSIFRGTTFFHLSKGLDSEVSISNTECYLQKDALNKLFEVIAVSIYDNKVFFGRRHFKGSDYLRKENTRRSPMHLPISKVEGLDD